MRMRQRLLTLLALCLFVGGGLYAAGLAWGRKHVRDVTGGGPDADVRCTRCHGPKSEMARGAMGEARAAPWALVPASDGRLLFAASGPRAAVLVADVARGRQAAEIPVGGEPVGLSLDADGGTLAVSVRDRDEVALVDVGTRQVRARIAVGTAPAGLAFADGGRRLVVANSTSGDVSVVDVERQAEVRRLRAGREPFAVRTSPDGRTVAVASRMADTAPADDVPRSELTLVDARAGAVLRRVSLPSCHLVEDLAFTPDGRWLLLPALSVKNLLPILQVARGWVMASVLVRVEVSTGACVVLPLTGVVEGFGDPTGIALSPDGRSAYVAAGGGDEVAVVDLDALAAAAADAPAGTVERLSDTRRYLRTRFPVGSNPRALALLEGGRLAVAERLGDAIGLYDATDGRSVGRIPVGPRLEDDAIQRGARAFHDAKVAFQAAFSCRSCHPEGHTDGLTYDFEIDGVGEDVVLNRSLRGVAGTDPFKWVGLNPTIQRQCGARFAMVLTRADVFPEDRLNDLVAYIHSLPAPRPDPEAGRVGGRDTGAVRRGKAIFERSTRKDGTPIPASGRCITCHPPPHYTSRMRADVGTRGPRDSTGLFDVPHLTGIASKAPYLHDGRATSLEEIWTLPGVLDHHGVVTDLNKTDLNDLIEYMKGL